MTLSFVIPTHDTPDLLLRCLASVVREAPGAQVVVVDDGGTDQIGRRVQERQPGTVVLRHEAARGFSAAANAGLAAADGQILVCLNSDTELEPGSVEALRTAFAENSELGIGGARLLYPDGRPQWSGGAEPDLLWLFALTSGLGRFRRFLSPRKAPLEEPALRRLDWVSGAALAIRRATWTVAGPFSERYRFYAQDLELCRRAHDRGFEIGVVGGFRVLHHHGATIAPHSTGADRGQRLDLLWPDLADWYQGRHGPAAGGRARRAMLSGARLRLALTRDPMARRAVEAGMAALAETRSTRPSSKVAG